MGIDDHFSISGSAAAAVSAPLVGVFVSPAQARTLTGHQETAVRVMMVVREVALGDPLPASDLAGIAVAVVEVDPAERRSVERLTQLIRSRPDCHVIAAVSRADIALTRTLVREGVADVIALPINPADATQAALDALARHAEVKTGATLAPMIGVIRTAGGCGATTVATHLASALSQHEWPAGGALLADLDLQFGEAAAYLNSDRSGSLLDLIAAQDRIDGEFLRSVAVETVDGLAVLAVPDRIESIESVDVDALLSIVQQMRRTYGVVVIDFPPCWSNWSASLAVAADLLLVVTDVSLPSLRQARRIMGLFDTLGIARDNVELVGNRMEKRMFRRISLAEAEAALGRALFAALPLDRENVGRAQEQGLTAERISRRSPFAVAIRDLAATIRQRLPGGERT